MRRVAEIGGLCPRILAMNCQPAFDIVMQIGNSCMIIKKALIICLIQKIPANEDFYLVKAFERVFP